MRNKVTTERDALIRAEAERMWTQRNVVLEDARREFLTRFGQDPASPAKAANVSDGAYTLPRVYPRPPEYQNLAAPSQAHDKPASSRSQKGDAEITDAVDEKKYLDTEKDELKTKVAEVEAKVAEVEGKKTMIADFVEGQIAEPFLNQHVRILGGWDESDRRDGKPSDRIRSKYDSLQEEKKSLQEEKKSLNAQLESVQRQLEEIQKRLTLRAQAPPQDGLVEKVDFLVAQAEYEERRRRREEKRRRDETHREAQPLGTCEQHSIRPHHGQKEQPHQRPGRCRRSIGTHHEQKKQPHQLPGCKHSIGTHRKGSRSQQRKQKT
ncbi:hypothetical protein DIPPA_07742 [Diplonema papillatum]|nr:hypothetical protein DIPPA_07742 [Diplonema papillatum]